MSGPEGEARAGEARGGDRAASSTLDDCVRRAAESLLGERAGSGYWCFELEADCTIPAEFVLLAHYMDEVDEDLEAAMARYLRLHQAGHGGWPLYHGGGFDLSATVKAYYALKLAGDGPEEPHMRRARDAVLAHGGAERSNVFTRITLALFGQVPWHAVPFMPVEILLLPAWSPFHIHKVAYWSRVVMVPLFVLCTLRPRARNPRGLGIPELFLRPPARARDWFRSGSTLERSFLWLDFAGRRLERLVPGAVRRRALRRAEAWVVERLNGEDGLGAIFPAMVNAHEMLAALGHGPRHPLRRQTRAALDGLVVRHGDTAYCQPCTSPVWDTGLSLLALLEAGVPPERLRPSLDWLAARQLGDVRGDWRVRRPGLEGGGWPFQFSNPHYPDIDDTPLVAWAMLRADAGRYAENIRRAAAWIAGMQSRNGGWASFDADNTCDYLNAIPFADHGALLDPPSSDVTARCVTFLALHDAAGQREVIARGVDFLRREQEADGCWFGRWGTNYLYGTWSALTALEAAGLRNDAMVTRAIAWLRTVQREDGGFGESNDSYADPGLRGRGGQATPHQTAWALLALVAAGEGGSPAAARAAAWLAAQQARDGAWHCDQFTAPGFPRAFYLRYHGYRRYFPLWALARYRAATGGPP